MTEVWRDIILYRDIRSCYQVSNLGRVKSLRRKRCTFGWLKERILKIVIDSYGYPKVCLSVHGEGQVFRVHRLVAEAFLSNPESKPQVNHKNGVKSDNKVINLEWVTSSENMQHSYKILNKPILKGENHGRAKLMDSQVSEIKKVLQEDSISQKKLARLLNVDDRTINLIKLGKTWGHII